MSILAICTTSCKSLTTTVTQLKKENSVNALRIEKIGQDLRVDPKYAIRFTYKFTLVDFDVQY